MTRFPFVSISVIAAAFGASGAAIGGDASPVLKPAPAPAVPTATAPRALSPGAVAQLTASTPKYDPVIAKKAAEPEPAPDLRETDKPRNTIIRLPRYLVQEDKPLVLKERDLETPKEQLRRALRKYPGLHFGSFGIFSNDGIALFMDEEEKRLQRMREASDLMSLLPVADQKKMKPAVDQSFIRYEFPR